MPTRMEQNDRLRQLLQQLRRAQFSRSPSSLILSSCQLASRIFETRLPRKTPNRTRRPQSVRDPEKATSDQPRIAAGTSAARACHARSRQYGMPLLPWSDACHRRGNRRRLDKIPAQYQVIVTHRPKYGYRACAGAIVQAPTAERLIKSGIPTENLVAVVVVDNYAWHNPLYRQSQIMTAAGLARRAFDISLAGSAPPRPKSSRVYLRMKEIVLASAKIVVDETRAPC